MIKKLFLILHMGLCFDAHRILANMCLMCLNITVVSKMITVLYLDFVV